MTAKEMRESVGLLAVVFGLIFVGLEMRQNTRMMQAQIRNSMTENQIANQLMFGSSLETARVIRLAFNAPDSLTADELMMAERLWLASMREYENSHYQYEMGLFSADEYQARRTAWQGLFNRPLVREFWYQMRDQFAPSFRELIDRFAEEAERSGR